MPEQPLHRISPVATLSDHDRVLAITEDLIARKAADAAASERLRDIHVLHAGAPDTLQRMLNAVQPGTYIAPHRHNTPPKAEAILVLQGVLGLVTFLDDGTPDEANSICMDPRRGVYGVDYRAGIWHTFIALEPDTVVFEVKPGPYDPEGDKGFAPWAPQEGDPEAQAYLTNLEDRFRTLWDLPPREWG